MIFGDMDPVARSKLILTNCSTAINSLLYDIPRFTSQWLMRSDTYLCFWHNVKKSVRLKLKIMSIICRFHDYDVVLTVLAC